MNNATSVVERALQADQMASPGARTLGFSTSATGTVEGVLINDPVVRSGPRAENEDTRGGMPE